MLTLMQKRLILSGLGLLAALGSPSVAQPNILFIFSDDHAQRAIGAYGGILAGLDPTPRTARR